MKPETIRAVVTAGASGIGHAIVESLLSAGARVHVADRDAAAVVKLPLDPASLSASVADVSDPDSVKQMFQEARENLGSVNVLINCAGIAGPTAKLEDIDPEAWHQCVAVNLDATFLCTQQVIPDMKKAKAGIVINMSSTAGLHGYPMRTPYASAKWALIGLTKSLAMELGPWDIRVNAICPGAVEGPRMDAVIAAESAKREIPEDNIRHTYTRATSMRTFVSAQDIANMALFLCSPGGGRVSGQAITVDGHTESYGTMETPPGFLDN